MVRWKVFDIQLVPELHEFLEKPDYCICTGKFDGSLLVMVSDLFEHRCAGINYYLTWREPRRFDLFCSLHLKVLYVFKVDNADMTIRTRCFGQHTAIKLLCCSACSDVK
ncbi:hypothetical protein Droror1_Dr00009908 [Drosera rotundifolia]